MGFRWCDGIVRIQCNIKPDASAVDTDDDKEVIVHVNEVKTDGEADRH